MFYHICHPMVKMEKDKKKKEKEKIDHMRKRLCLKDFVYFCFVLLQSLTFTLQIYYSISIFRDNP